MSDIFREVDEDVRRDSLTALWQKYSIFVYALAFGIVAATAAYSLYSHLQNQRAEAAGAQYEAALEQLTAGKTEEAKAALTQAQTSGTYGYGVLSRFQLAALAASKDTAEGAKAYEALAVDPSLDAGLRDAARLQASLLTIDAKSPDQLQKDLASLIAGDNPYRNSARELLGLSALKAKDYDNAGRWFDAILTDAAAPQALRNRAEAFASLVKTAKPVAKPAN